VSGHDKSYEIMSTVFDTLSRRVLVGTHASLRSKRSPLEMKNSKMDSQALRMKCMKHHYRDHCDFHVPEKLHETSLEIEWSLSIKIECHDNETEETAKPFLPFRFQSSFARKQ
jgi:hypothetical protein